MRAFPEIPKPNVPQPLREELNGQLELIHANLPGVAAALINAAFLHFLVVNAEINNHTTEQKRINAKTVKKTDLRGSDLDTF